MNSNAEGMRVVTVRRFRFPCMVALLCILVPHSSLLGADTTAASSKNTLSAEDASAGSPPAATAESDLIIPVECYFGDSTEDWTDKLTGAWFGARDQLADCGIRIDTNLTQFYQGVVSGGKERTGAYGGKLDYFLNIDGAKLGCEGFSVAMHAETRYGDDINAEAGTFALANINIALPVAEEELTAITRLIFSQSLCDNLVVFGGKINSLDDFELNFTGRNGIDRFMNGAVVANIINSRAVPYSTYGAGLSVLSEKEPVFTFIVRDSDNRPTTLDLDELFSNGVLLSGTVRIPVAPCGLPGHRNFGVNWNSRSFTAVDPEAFVEVPGQGIVASQKSGTWAVWHNFDQYLWVSPTNPDQGWGIFGMTGLSDGNPNPIRWNMTIGIGGNSVLPGRERDTCGVGYFRIGLSDDFKDLLASPLAPPGLEQRDEHGVELFYNVNMTPWSRLTGDLQFVQPSTQALDLTVVAGLRWKIDF